MRVLVQRVSEASVVIDSIVKGQIKMGLLLLLGIEENDEDSDIDWLCKKIVNMRIFGDENGHMNLSLLDVGGEILLISQFTLHAKIKKGNRPSFIKAAHPNVAVPLYQKFIAKLEEQFGRQIEKGEFGADMKVKLVNDGPVSIWMDSKNKE